MFSFINGNYIHHMVSHVVGHVVGPGVSGVACVKAKYAFVNFGVKIVNNCEYV